MLKVRNKSDYSISFDYFNDITAVKRAVILVEEEGIYSRGLNKGKKKIDFFIDYCYNNQVVEKVHIEEFNKRGNITKKRKLERLLGKEHYQLQKIVNQYFPNQINWKE